MTRVLIAGVGNVLFGDDGFGPAVAARLESASLPPGARVMDAGVRGFDLTSELLNDYDAAILIDAAVRGGTPGTLYLLEPSAAVLGDDYGLDLTLDPHRLEPSRVLLLARASGAKLECVRVLACEPALTDEMTDVLSPAVRAAVGPAAELVQKLAWELVEGSRGHA
jgi:hydrogenase maturation protease